MHKNELLCQEIIKRIDMIDNDELKNLIISLIDSQKSLTDIVFIDPLTNVYNRRIIHKISDCNVAIMCDIDDFKYINDTYGHVIGDRILQYVAKTISANVRPTDYVCRYGGDEFFISLTSGNEDVAIKRMKIIQQQLLENAPLPIDISISIGIATRNGINDVHELIDKADNALYYSKLSGKNAITILEKRKKLTKNLVLQ